MKNNFKTTILLLLMICFSLNVFSQQYNYQEVSLENDIMSDEDAPVAIGYSPNGEIFTPKGTLKVLVIFAGFEGDVGNQYIEGWDADNPNSCPDYVDEDSGEMPDLLFGSESDFETVIMQDPENRSISRFFYDMSYTDFKMIGDVFKAPNTGEPFRINIDPTGASSWSTCNKLVLQEMDNLYPTFNWDPYLSQYDNRDNWPNFQFDNSDTDTYPPDNKLDYVVIIWRWDPTWENQPVPNIEGWDGSGGGISGLGWGTSHTFDSYTISTGFTLVRGERSPLSLLGTFVHEVAHEVFSCPHIMGANGCAGKRFHSASGGWGMISYLRYMLTANAWESWMCGWIDLTTENDGNSDIKSQEDLNEDGIYTIGDFLTTGDIIRIKIPNTTDHYLWIENRQKLGVWEFDPMAGSEPSLHGETIPDSETGIYMYIENVQGDRNNVSTSLVGNMDRVNGIKVLNPQGNYDYNHSTTATVSWNEYWHNPLFTFEKGESNPISGINPFYNYPDNFPNDPTIPVFDDEITWLNDKNKGTNEAHSIVKETNGSDTYLLFANTSGVNSHADYYFDRRSDAFLVNDELSLSGIMPILNFPKYNKISTNPASDPYLLNGLNVKIISYNEVDHSFQIQIKFDDYQIRSNKRWTGNIHLYNNSGDDQADIDIQSGVTIRIDKSGVPNRHTMTVNNDFINPTEFQCKTDSKVIQQTNSNVIVENGSTLKLESGSTYEIMDGAELLMEDNSIFEMEPCSKLIIHGSGQINFVPSSVMKISEGAILIFDDISENLFYDISKVVIPDGFVNPYDIMPPEYIITGSKMWDEEEYYIYNDVEIKDNAIFTIKNSDLIFGADAKLVVEPGGKLIIDGAKLTNSCDELWEGIRVFGDKNLSQQDESNQGVLEIKPGSVIENARRAIYVGNPDSPGDNSTGGIVKIDGATFKDNVACVEMPQYHNFLFNNPNIQGNNRSYIINCTFETTDYLASLGKIPYSFIGLWQVEGVNIKYNTFKNSNPTAYPST